jgi:hypothetical protein
MWKDKAVGRAEDEKSAEFTSSSSDERPATPQDVDENVDEKVEGKAEEKTEERTEEDADYPTGLPLAFMMLGLCLAVFVVALGTFCYSSISQN